MADRRFSVFMAFAVLILMVMMSTPVTSTGVQDAAAKLIRHLSQSDTQAAKASAG